MDQKNIVKLFAVNIDEKYVVQLFELCNGWNLRKFLKLRDGLEEKELQFIMK